MLAALDYGPGNKGRDPVNYLGIVKTPPIKELSLDFKARSGYTNSSDEEFIVTEEKEEVNEPRSDNGSPA